MEKIRSLVVDDEAGSRDVLCRLLQKYFPEIEVVGEAENAQGAYELAIAQQPQLVFLDIQMPRADGFSLLKRFEEVPFEVIFVTSYDKYAINAIRFNALDYLLKPVEIPELKSAVQKVLQRMQQRASHQPQVISLLHSLESNAAHRKLAVHSGEKVKLLEVQDIECVEADRRYSHLFLAGHENYTLARTLSELEEYLCEDPRFVRISKSLIINTDYIKEYSKGEPFIIELKNGKTFEIPRRKKTEILEKLKK